MVTWLIHCFSYGDDCGYTISINLLFLQYFVSKVLLSVSIGEPGDHGPQTPKHQEGTEMNGD